MDETSARHALPFILPGQAQKELFHNEALAVIDAALHATVEGTPVSTTPASPQSGQCWLVASGAAGAWAGEDNNLASWTSGGWRFIRPVEGMAVWDRVAQLDRRWTGGEWSHGEISAASVTIGGAQVLGSRQPAVTSPSGGTTIDTEARAALHSLLVALRTHGLIE
jgi:hypothetical protein